jgi:hypothetical protein
MKRYFTVFVACLLLATVSCSHITVAPKPIETHQISSWAKQNILDADTTGVLVTAEFIRVYHELLSAYSPKLKVSSRPASPNDGIKPEKGNFRISYVVQSRFAELKDIDRGNP